METTQSGNTANQPDQPQQPQQTNPSADERRGCRGGRYGNNGHHGHRGRRGGRFIGALFFALVAGGIGGYIGKSFAKEPTSDEHVERMVKRFAGKVDATPAQKERLTAIARDAARDLAPIRTKLSAARKQAVALMGAATVDRAAIEALRAEQVTLADGASKRVTQAMADVADVLTPEQRQKLAAGFNSRLERHGEHRFGFWHHG